MELGALLELVREEIDDVLGPYLWSDEKLTRFLNEAVTEAAVRARLLVESELASVCQIALVADQSRYPLHKSVILIRRGVLASNLSDPLCRTNTADLDGYCSWRGTRGKPKFLIVDQQGPGRTLLVSPTPTEAETLHLTVLRYPTDNELLESEADEPAIAEEHHVKLVHWAAFRALNQRDIEQQSKSDAADQLALFEAHFGPRPTALQLQQLAIDRLGGTAPHYF